jgi:hypothetical protein
MVHREVTTENYNTTYTWQTNKRHTNAYAYNIYIKTGGIKY